MAAVLSALQAGDNAGAEAALTPLLAVRPEDPQILRLLAIALVRQNRPHEAEPLLRRFVAVEPSVDSLTFLADIQYRIQAFADCEATLARIVGMNAATPVQLRQLAKVKSVTGKAEDARVMLRAALERAPGDIDLIAAYGDSFAADPAQACAALEEMLPRVAGRHDHTSFLLKRITLHRARANRRAAGLSPDVAASWQETCDWPDPDGLARLQQALMAELTAGATVRGGAYLDLACVALAHQNWAFAEHLLGTVRRAMREPTADCAAFGAAFHEPLERQADAQILEGFAPVRHVFRLIPHAPATMFVACDYGYFKRFALPFVKALEDAGIRADVQIHLLDGDTGQWAAAGAALAFAKGVHLGLSAEASGALAQGPARARLYFHAARFIRLYQDISRTGRATWLLDADVNLVRNPTPLFKAFKGFDVAVCGNPSAFEPTAKITANCVGIAPTELGLEYARRVAAYVAHWKAQDRWSWGVDQMALYSCYGRMCELGRPPSTQFLGGDVFHGLGEADGVFDFLGGVRKYAPGAG
ncbi:MAG: tetratricopeptide repeat protein [Rhodospirillaceae bacterium]|nr:tetratricopeptide repeat protein [Rhodospirillaceae bacterium]